MNFQFSVLGWLGFCICMPVQQGQKYVLSIRVLENAIGFLYIQ